MASAGESLLHSTTAPPPGEDEVGRVVECMCVELAETLEVGLEVRRILGSTFASVLMVGVAPPVGDSVTKLLEFSTSLKPSSLTNTLATLTVDKI